MPTARPGDLPSARPPSRPSTSIIMPVFDEEPGRLERAIASVLQQTSSRWELIIVSDDGRDYEQVLAPLVDRDPRFRFISTGREGAGPSYARNLALDIARGDAVAFLDSDDFLEPEKLAVMAPLAMAFGVAIDNTRFRLEGDDTPAGTYLEGEADGMRDLSFYLNIPWPLLTVYNRRRFRDARYAAEVRFAEDMLFNYDMLHTNGGGYFVSRPMHNYLIRPSSLSHAPDAAERADVAYGRIVQLLTDKAAPAVLVEAMQRKRAINREYLVWLRHQCGSFHEFIHARQAADGPASPVPPLLMTA